MPASLRFARSWQLVPALILSAVVLFAAAGCGKTDRLPVHPTAGQLSWRGKPLENALIVLHPMSATDPRVLPARGQTDANGKFQVTTYEQSDGAVAGEYRVTVECYKPIKTASGLEPGPNVLPKKFSQAATSTIVVRVAEGANTLEPIVLR
jgi:hypothetical protein